MGKKTNPCPKGMALIPDSRFMMGSDGITKLEDEKPRHEVRATDFCLDRHEVTNKEYAPFNALAYEAIIKSCETNQLLSIIGRSDDRALLARRLKSLQDVDGKNVCGEVRKVTPIPIPAGSGDAKRPIGSVNWFEANAYCKAHDKRLPTEAEWEKAAIGPTKGYDRRVEYGTRSGELTPEEAVYLTNRSAPVCSKPANPYGLCDMTGNVWEWVHDWYASDYYQKSPNLNPAGPMSGDFKVLRGGTFNYFIPGTLRVAYRIASLPTLRKPVFGFRCAK